VKSAAQRSFFFAWCVKSGLIKDIRTRNTLDVCTVDMATPIHYTNTVLVDGHLNVAPIGHWSVMLNNQYQLEELLTRVFWFGMPFYKIFSSKISSVVNHINIQLNFLHAATKAANIER
jgi:hypothetical protein